MNPRSVERHPSVPASQKRRQMEQRTSTGVEIGAVRG